MLSRIVSCDNATSNSVSHDHLPKAVHLHEAGLVVIVTQH